MRCLIRKVNRLALLATVLTAQLAMALPSDRAEVLIFEANSVTANEADELTTLTGDVLLQQGTLEITAAVARLYGPVAALERLVVEGNPASLQQQIEAEPGLLTATAERIEYHLDTRTIELTGNAEVDQGNRHLSGEHITYDLVSGRVVGEGGDGRVRIRIDPETEAQPPVN